MFVLGAEILKFDPICQQPKKTGGVRCISRSPTARGVTLYLAILGRTRGRRVWR